MASTPSLAVAVLDFMGCSVNTSKTSVTLNPVKMEAPARTAWAPTAALAQQDTTDRTVR